MKNEGTGRNRICPRRKIFSKFVRQNECDDSLQMRMCIYNVYDVNKPSHIYIYIYIPYWLNKVLVLLSNSNAIAHHFRNHFLLEFYWRKWHRKDTIQRVPCVCDKPYIIQIRIMKIFAIHQSIQIETRFASSQKKNEANVKRVFHVISIVIRKKTRSIFNLLKLSFFVQKKEDTFRFFKRSLKNLWIG